MRNSTVSKAVLAAALVALGGSAALAGPPLVCWKVHNGGAPSLPWTDNPHSYDGTRSEYDTRRLADDTLALLGPDAPVLARMETLRRAALYGARDAKAGDALVTRLVERAKGARDPLAWFDLGYLVEAVRQARGAHEPYPWTRLVESMGIRATKPKDLPKASGYDCVLEAIELRGSDPDMEYAAALITWYPRQPSHETHLARAVAGAAEGSPLAANLVEHFQDRGRTLAELRANVASR